MSIPHDQIDPDALKVVERLHGAGHKAYLVGGCVRDLLLGGRPKDFDVATSATPPELRRLFRNCRIIGRRFRLAHIFYGAKVIETATFRANPRALEDDDSEAPTETETGDLLIRRDNVFGSEEEDARRRDFTLNGLFYDPSSKQVIDHVAGLVDIDARLLRTIGDPDVRFREDPIRILRAVKFAARCGLTIEAETYRRLLEHRGEIAKSAPARVSEEFYRLLRSGAAHKSMQLLVETGLLGQLSPDLERTLSGDAADDDTVLRRKRLWAYLDALDRYAAGTPRPPSNALILAVLATPALRDAMDPDARGVKDAGAVAAAAAQPFLERLRASRRDSELARQILLALRYLLPSRVPGRRRPSLAGRDFFDDAQVLVGLLAAVEATDPSLAPQPVETGAETAETAPAGDDEALPDELVLAPILDSDRRGRRRRGRGRDGRDRDGREAEGRDREGDDRGGRLAAGPGAPRGAAPAAFPIDSKPGKLPTLLPPLHPPRPAFLGSGGFGGRWGSDE